MRVYELFKYCNTDKVADMMFDEYFKDNESYNYGFRKLLPWQVMNFFGRRRCRKNIKKVFEEVANLEPINDHAYILLDDIFIDTVKNKRHLQMSLFRKIDIDDKFSEYKELSELDMRRFETVSTEELRRIDLRKFQLVKPFSYEMSPWEEIIGFEIGPDVMKRHNGCEILVQIIYEMTFWGWSNKSIQKQAQDIIDESENALSTYHEDIDDNQLDVEKNHQHEDLDEVTGVDGQVYDYYPDVDDEDVRALFESELLTYERLFEYRDAIIMFNREVVLLPDDELFRISNQVINDNYSAYKELAK